MPMHAYHPNLEGYDEEAILHDGCEECEERASKGIAGLIDLDSSNIDLLWRRCLNTEYGGTFSQEVPGGEYRSECESRLGHSLYLIGVLLQSIEDVWRPDRFAVLTEIVAGVRRITDEDALDTLNSMLSASEWPGASGLEDVCDVIRRTGRLELANAPSWERH